MILKLFKIQNIHNHHKRHWRTIYEAIHQYLFDETDIFPEEFLKHCKNNANVPFNITTDVKNNLKQIVTEQGLYAQVVMLFRNYFNITEETKNKNEDKFKFQGQSTRSQRWFDIDFDYIEEKFSTCETDFYKKIFQRRDETQDRNKFKMFVVPISNAKNMEEIKFHIDALWLKYRQITSNSSCFSSLAS